MNRVVVTGLGAITPVGNSPAAMFAAALAGRSAVRRAPELAAGGSTPLVASADFDPAGIVLRQRSAPMDRATAMAIAAVHQAVADAGPGFRPGTHDTGIYWGTGMGAAGTVEDGYRAAFKEDDWRLKPTSIVTAMNNAPAALISLEYGITGPAFTYSIAGASSAVAVGEALRAIRHGIVRCAIAGGSEALLTRGVLSAWTALRTLAQPDDDVACSCKPFAANRSGFVLGEGAGAIVLESADRAAERGAHAYAELAGFGFTSDASHIADPSSDGRTRAIAQALSEARIAPSEVGYINAHGTATLVGDRVETTSIKRAFGAHASRIPVSSTKAVHGHVMGATGAIELMIALLALESGSVPPTAHHSCPDPELNLDFVPASARHGITLSAVVSNSFGFGGSNAVLVARQPGREFRARRP